MLQRCLAFLLVLNIFFTGVLTKLTGESVISTKAYAIWKNATVPFYVNPTHFDHEQTTAILTALSIFAYKTCLKFKPVMARPQPTDEVMVFINPDGTRRCQIETKGHNAFNPHVVKLGYECLQSPQIDMMIMRALGFPFEHNRGNRDLYVDVLQENIEPGAIELFTKEDTLPLEMRFLPYDVNSVMHFSNREYSKNGHRTIIFKDATVKQNRVSLTDTDLRKIEIVYGPECRARDRQEKVDLCQSYPGVARKKRQIDDRDVDKQDQTIRPVERKKRNVEEETSATKSLRVNPDITPPPPENLTDDVTKTLKELGIESEVEEIVDKVFKVSSLALKNAREKYCSNNSQVQPPTIEGKDITSRNSSDILGIIEVVANFAKGMVDDALKNLTKFCEVSEGIEAYQRFHCDMGGRDPRCRDTYRSTKSGPVQHSTQHRPFIRQSTRHIGGEKARPQYGRAGEVTEEENPQSTTPSLRKKRETSSTTEKPVEETKGNKTEASEDNTNKELTEMEKAVETEVKSEDMKKNETEDGITKEGETTVKETDNKINEDDKTGDNKEEKKESDDINVKTPDAEVIKINNKEIFRMGTLVPGARMDNKFRRKSQHRGQSDASSQELDNLDKILAKKIVAKKHHLQNNDKKYPKDRDIEETRDKIKEKTRHHHRHKKAKLHKHLEIPRDEFVKEEKFVSVEEKVLGRSIEDKEEEEEGPSKEEKEIRKPKRIKKKQRKDVVKFSAGMREGYGSDKSESSGEDDKRPRKKEKPHAAVHKEENEEESESGVPRTVELSKKNEEFYNERRWPGGEIVYYIQEDTTYDISDMRQRLNEVNAILKKRTCTSLREIQHEQADGYEDYIVIDNSPDYVTGRVGGQQRFGSIELFRGGQHRQHAAMMVMAMLGFYFEVSRHDRDKYIRVHMRHVRPDKLHHFEMIRSDATLPLPYDYASATHPAWQFWRQIGRTGISTVATFKEKDPDGSIMKSLGQNQKLLSDLDIVKINSVYGVECFTKNQLRSGDTKKPKNVLRVKTYNNNRTTQDVDIMEKK